MVVWCDLDFGRYSIGDKWSVQLALTLMLACFACVLWFSLATNRDGFWVGFLLCVGVLSGQQRYWICLCDAVPL